MKTARARSSIRQHSCNVLRTITQLCSEKAPLCFQLEVSLLSWPVPQTPGWLQHPNPLGVRHRPWTEWPQGDGDAWAPRAGTQENVQVMLAELYGLYFPSSPLSLFFASWRCRCIRIWGTVTSEGLSVSQEHVILGSCGWKTIENNAVQAEGKLVQCRVRFREERTILGCPLVAERKSLMIIFFSTSKTFLWLQRSQCRGPCVYSLNITSAHSSKTIQVLSDVSNSQVLAFNEPEEALFISVGQKDKTKLSCIAEECKMV